MTYNVLMGPLNHSHSFGW